MGGRGAPRGSGGLRFPRRARFGCVACGVGGGGGLADAQGVCGVRWVWGVQGWVRWCEVG